MYQARQTAIDRMTAECAALGGHGVVGVRLSRGSLPLGGLDFTALGTAVRAPGAAHGRRALFTCDVSGQDFAKLIAAGWVPAGLALGISVGSRHDDRRLAGQARRWSGNVEVAGWTELVNQSRRDARRQLEQDVGRLGGEGVVITGVQMRVRERDCPATVGRRDHIVEVTLTGTAIARFSRPARVRRPGPDGHAARPATPPGRPGPDVGSAGCCGRRWPLRSVLAVAVGVGAAVGAGCWVRPPSSRLRRGIRCSARPGSAARNRPAARARSGRSGRTPARWPVRGPPRRPA